MNTISLVQLVASFALILLGATVFVNAVEWLGKRLDLAHGATGSVLAAIGTALPESMIPAVALLTAADESGHDVGIGAILGAPLLLSTIAMGLVAVSLIVYSRRTGRPARLMVDRGQVRRDLRFFLVAYAAAITVGLLPLGANPKVIAAIAFIVLFAIFVYRTVRANGGAETHELGALKFAPRSSNPATVLIALQLVAALLLLIGGAHLCVISISHIALALGIPALILALVIAPLATELPEKLNSVIWIGQGKDTLAMGNLTGAMVFQSTIPVALGVAFTQWELSGPSLVSAVLSVAAAAILLAVFSRKSEVGPAPLFVSGLLYVAFIVYLLVL